jgi:adenine/guanine/hypoxanthine permease
LFLPFIFFSPLLSIVPSIATAPALVLVGVFIGKTDYQNQLGAIG